MKVNREKKYDIYLIENLSIKIIKECVILID